jgi:uncharacterized protein (DUF2141 family)
MQPTILFYLFCCHLLYLPPEQREAEILIRNIKNTKGSFVISLYDDAAAFPKVGKALLTETVTVRDTMPHLNQGKSAKGGLLRCGYVSGRG